MKPADCIRAFATALALAAAVVTAGCSPGDVQFEGKIFNAMGMNNTTTRETPKVAARSGLVVPPDLERLPEPGSGEGASPEDAALAGINDPDRAKTIDQAALQKQQEEYCKKHYDPAVAMGAGDADQISGPLGPCRKSILSSMKQWTGQSNEQ